MLPGTATAAPAATTITDPADAVQNDSVPRELQSPLADKQQAEQTAAVEQLVNGTAKVEQHGNGSSIKLGRDKYVELSRERTDKIFTILVDFGDQVDTTTKTADGKVKYGGTPGPAHNQIAAPDRKNDNSTAWQADYNQAHYQDIYFAKDKPSLKTYYERQSSGRYSVDGLVTDWVRVPWNEARYGSDYCGQHVCANAQDLIRDGIDAWVADQKAKGRTDAQIKADLAQYDQWDRYDYNGNGNFNEPDGYLDHFQIVHAGEDQSAGGGVQGTDALWAHRSYAYANQAGKTGPDNNKLGGTQIGATGLWVGDYTMQPENGGLGVFAHEYGHDLGLPDLYDTTGQGIDNSVGFWSLMSSGSWLGEGKNEIGDMPNDLDVWSKLKLGWLNYDTAKAGQTSLSLLGPVEYNTKRKQGLVVNLPPKTVTTEINTPFEGGNEWWSGSADNLNVTLTRTVDLTGKTSAKLTAKAWIDLEQDYDFAYAEVSTDGGKNWSSLAGTLNGAAIADNALTGSTNGWADLAFPLDAYAGKSVQVRFHNTTDPGVHNKGIALDNISVTADGAALFTDGAENGDNGWTAAGFSRISGKFSKDYDQHYLVENRQYVSFDTTLKTGPYNFGSAARPDWVEHYANQNGILIWLWDSSQSDNNVFNHPGQGLILPVDAHPAPLKWNDGTLMRPRFQSYDATFGSDRTDGLQLHKADALTKIPSSRGVTVFNDHTTKYWFPENQYSSVQVPDTGTQIEVLWQSHNDLEAMIKVKPVKK
ncbi:immune inhibitor A [Kitasatospora sp. YST-16]|uniref:immune inhibitor A domain-containing protein n=1 Tax=Kitasatospora sp. NRRL B-11411 TaxID=1463822 RepID=UPI001E4B8B43|nr:MULTISPECIES: immune inhibitor A domain-containing protein [unclassified Kitasatospora]WAL76391.1 immune inhibitor A [Kitasatospora sp. YST-16]WNW42421.1 immune inhibitor A [Streptomyces sp. Li-HN-5-13]